MRFLQAIGDCQRQLEQFEASTKTYNTALELRFDSGDKNSNYKIKGDIIHNNTAIPYRVSTGPEQGFPCVVFSHREKPVFSSWDPCNENRIFPVGNTTQGKPCFHYRDGFAVYSVHSSSMLCKSILGLVDSRYAL